MCLAGGTASVRGVEVCCLFLFRYLASTNENENEFLSSSLAVIIIG